ncbi:MAG TPA: peptidoglycan binding domain-containing protein, partial [Candidatus Saccharimonadales bacterium]
MKRQRRNTPRALLSARMRRRIIIAMCIVAGVFLLFNIALLAIYRNRTYPKTQMLGASIGSVPYSQLKQKVDQLRLLPKSVVLTYDGKRVSVSLEDLGVRSYTQRTVASANQQRSWLPIVNLFKSPELKAPIQIDDKALAAKAKELATTFAKAPVNAHIQIDVAKVTIVSEQPGYDLDQAKLQNSLMDCLDSKETKLVVPTKGALAQIKSTDLRDTQQSLEQQINTAITFKYNDKSRQTTAEDVAKWLAASGEGYSLSEINIRSYIANLGNGFGIRVKDVNQLAAAAATAINQHKPATLILTAQTV